MTSGVDSMELSWVLRCSTHRLLGCKTAWGGDGPGDEPADLGAFAADDRDLVCLELVGVGAELVAVFEGPDQRWPAAFGDGVPQAGQAGGGLVGRQFAGSDQLLEGQTGRPGFEGHEPDGVGVPLGRRRSGCGGTGHRLFTLQEPGPARRRRRPCRCRRRSRSSPRGPHPRDVFVDDGASSSPSWRSRMPGTARPAAATNAWQAVTRSRNSTDRSMFFTAGATGLVSSKRCAAARIRGGIGRAVSLASEAVRLADETGGDARHLLPMGSGRRRAAPGLWTIHGPARRPILTCLIAGRGS
jgi:hypothetical protein